MKQILQGVEHMHKKRIVHLDLKVGDSSWLLWSPSYKQVKVKVTKKQKKEQDQYIHYIMAKRTFPCGTNAGNPEQQYEPYLTRSGSQLEHRICFTLPPSRVQPYNTVSPLETPSVTFS